LYSWIFLQKGLIVGGIFEITKPISLANLSSLFSFSLLVIGGFEEELRVEEG